MTDEEIFQIYKNEYVNKTMDDLYEPGLTMNTKFYNHSRNSCILWIVLAFATALFAVWIDDPAFFVTPAICLVCMIPGIRNCKIYKERIEKLNRDHAIQEAIRRIEEKQEAKSALVQKYGFDPLSK